jgi:hypothetical protein
VDALRTRLAKAVEFARGTEEVRWTHAAMELWTAEYPRLTAARTGAFGKATGRAEAHALRLALLYALLDRSAQIKAEHLQAALAVWGYAERSALYTFGDSTEDRDADRILEALRAAPEGLTRSEIRRKVFDDNKPAAVIRHKLAILFRQGLARFETVETGGRPAQRWLADSGHVNVKNVESPPRDDLPTPEDDLSPPDDSAYHVNHVHVPVAAELSDAPSPPEDDPSHVNHVHVAQPKEWEEGVL